VGASLEAMQIYTFTYKNQDIDLTVQNGFLAYSFVKEGQTHGAKVKLPSRKTADLVAHTFNLVLNALETIDKLNENH